MTAPHDTWTERLSEYVDGDLAGADREELERHLAGCAECRATAEELRQVSATARTLAPVAPVTDGWPALRAIVAVTPQDGANAPPIAAPATVAPAAPRVLDLRRHPRWWSRPLTLSWAPAAAAAVLLVVLAGGGAWLALRPAPGVRTEAPIAVRPVLPTPGDEASGDEEAGPKVSEPADLQAPDGVPLDDAPRRARRVAPGAAPDRAAPAERPVTDAVAVSFDPRYDATVADLQRLLASERSNLDTSTVRILEQNLAVIDRALAEARRAVASDPANPYLRAHLASTMRRKVDLLRRATVIAGARG